MLAARAEGEAKERSRREAKERSNPEYVIDETKRQEGLEYIRTDFALKRLRKPGKIKTVSDVLQRVDTTSTLSPEPTIIVAPNNKLNNTCTINKLKSPNKLFNFNLQELRFTDKTITSFSQDYAENFTTKQQRKLLLCIIPTQPKCQCKCTCLI